MSKLPLWLPIEKFLAVLNRRSPLHAPLRGLYAWLTAMTSVLARNAPTRICPDEPAFGDSDNGPNGVPPSGTSPMLMLEFTAHVWKARRSSVCHWAVVPAADISENSRLG